MAVSGHSLKDSERQLLNLFHHLFFHLLPPPRMWGQSGSTAGSTLWETVGREGNALSGRPWRTSPRGIGRPSSKPMPSRRGTSALLILAFRHPSDPTFTLSKYFLFMNLCLGGILESSSGPPLWWGWCYRCHPITDERLCPSKVIPGSKCMLKLVKRPSSDLIYSHWKAMVCCAAGSPQESCHLC